MGGGDTTDRSRTRTEKNVPTEDNHQSAMVAVSLLVRDEADEPGGGRTRAVKRASQGERRLVCEEPGVGREYRWARKCLSVV